MFSYLPLSSSSSSSTAFSHSELFDPACLKLLGIPWGPKFPLDYSQIRDCIFSASPSVKLKAYEYAMQSDKKVLITLFLQANVFSTLGIERVASLDTETFKFVIKHISQSECNGFWLKFFQEYRDATTFMFVNILVSLLSKGCRPTKDIVDVLKRQYPPRFRERIAAMRTAVKGGMQVRMWTNKFRIAQEKTCYGRFLSIHTAVSNHFRKRK